MAFERNDIVVKTKLADALGDELMGFEHNDIVTTDVMNAAIAEGGGGLLSEVYPLAVNCTFKISGQETDQANTLFDLTDSGQYIYYVIEDERIINAEEFRLTNGDYDTITYSESANAQENGIGFAYDDTAWTVTVSGDAELLDVEGTKYVHIFGDCVVNAAYNE